MILFIVFYLSGDGVVFDDFVGDTFRNVFSGDFFDAQLTRGDDDADAAFVVGVDDFHGVNSAEDGDVERCQIMSYSIECSSRSMLFAPNSY